MDTRTGKIMGQEQVTALPAEEQRHFVEVKRDLSAKEKAEAQIAMYAPCVCGSGRKFRFCCFRKSK